MTYNYSKWQNILKIDPLTDDYPALSGYHYALNDPITSTVRMIIHI
jgi:hypothetical protein